MPAKRSRASWSPLYWLVGQGPGMVGVAILLAMVGHDMNSGPVAATSCAPETQRVNLDEGNRDSL